MRSGRVTSSPTRTAQTKAPSLQSWAAFFLVGACAAVWAKHEDIVVWLLSEGLIEEQATVTLPGTLRSAAVAAGIVAAVAAWRIAAWGLRIVYGWTPVHRRAAPLVQWLHALLSSIWELLDAVLLAAGNAIASPFRRAWQASSTTLGYLRRSARAAATFVRRGADAILQRLWLGIAAVARPVGVAARTVKLTVFRLLSAVWLPLPALAGRLSRAIAAAARAAELVLRACWWGITIIHG